MKVKYYSEIRCMTVPAPSRTADAKETQLSFHGAYGMRQEGSSKLCNAVYLSPAHIRRLIATLQKELKKFPKRERKR